MMFKKTGLALLALGLCSCAMWTKSSAPATDAGRGASAASSSSGDSSRTNTVSTPSRDVLLDPRGIDFSRAPETIAFSCCANQDAAQPIWKAIADSDADLFLFAGNSVEAKSGSSSIAEQYRKLDKIAEYREARQRIPFMAVWNDGEYGTIDGGANAPTRADARKAFLGYFRTVKDSLPLVREGVYHAKLIGGQVTGRRRKRVQGPTVQVIMLDTRTFRSPLKRAEDADHPQHIYDPNMDPKATILGEDQWDWLEEQFRKPAELRIVVTPVQMIPTAYGGEKWANFPRERERFFNLIKKTHVKNLLIVSGDRHLGVISRADVKGWGLLYEVTAGSINQPSDSVDETDPSFVTKPYPNENFGLAVVNWARKSVHLEIRGLDGKPITYTDLKMR